MSDTPKKNVLSFQLDPQLFEPASDAEKAQQWIKNGAQPTDVVKRLLKESGVVKAD